MTTEPTEQLWIALQATQAILAAVRDDQWGEPTPCTEWSVLQPGVLERVYTVPFGPVRGSVALHVRISEILVPGWDLAAGDWAAGEAA